MTDKVDSNDQPEDLEQQVEQQAKEQFERVLRLQADIENMKRRAEKDVANAHKYATEKLLKELVAVADSLEMAMQSEKTADTTAIVEGVELTHKLFLDVLGKHGVEQINPENSLFNPELHQAVSMQPNPDVDSNTVLQVMQKGYSLNGRLIRPAMVVVAQ